MWKIWLFYIFLFLFSCSSEPSKMSVSVEQQKVSSEVKSQVDLEELQNPNMVFADNGCWTPTPTVLYKDKRLGEVWNYADEMPEFLGGMDSLSTILQRELEDDFQSVSNCGGKSFYYIKMNVVIDKKGKVHYKNIIKGLSPDIDLKVLAALKALPNFIPAKINGKPINIHVTIPIRYELR